MRIAIPSATALALACGPVAAAAPTTMSDSWGFFAPVSDRAAREDAQRFTACLAAKRPKIVREAILMDYRTKQYRDELHELAQGSSCTQPGRLAMGGVIFPGGLAEAAFNADFSGIDIARIIPADWTARPIAALGETDVISYCMVQKAPDAVRALIATKAGSAEENTALQPLGVVLPQCVKAGATARFNKAGLRALLALALYRAAEHFRSAT